MTPTPKELGFRMPAEWENQSAIWLQWPYEAPSFNSVENTGDKTYQMKLEKTWLLMSWELHQHEKVCVIAMNQGHKSYLKGVFQYMNFDFEKIEIHIIPYMDVWHRDTGPIFIHNDKGELAATAWNFNGYGSYPICALREKRVANDVADRLSIRCFTAPIVTEGGAIEVNGTGSLVATRSSILNDNRNPGVSQQAVEKAFEDYLGVTNVIWLSGAPSEVCKKELGDGTDYHIDIAARFIAKNKVLYTWTDDKTDPRYPYLVQHREELKSARDEEGNALSLIPLETPKNGVYTTSERYDDSLGGDSDTETGKAELTDAAYTNFLLANNIVLLPVFGNVNDQNAKDVLSECFPDRKIITIPCVSLNENGGAIHCVTQQQPAV